MMLMNKVSPATLCPQEDGRLSDGPYAVVGNGSDNSSQYTQLSQYSQTSLELFSSQHSHNSNSQNGITNGLVETGRCTRLMGGANHYTSTLQATTGPSEYYLKYMSLPKLSDSKFQNRQSGNGTESGSGSDSQSSSGHSILSKSHYEEWMSERREKKENKSVIEAVVKVTKECAKEIGETVNDLKKSLTVELEPLSLHSISENTFKEEQSVMIEHQRVGFTQLLQGQSDLTQLLIQIQSHLQKEDTRLHKLESKIDSIVCATTDKLSSIQLLMEKVISDIDVLSTSSMRQQQYCPICERSKVTAENTITRQEDCTIQCSLKSVEDDLIVEKYQSNVSEQHQTSCQSHSETSTTKRNILTINNELMNIHEPQKQLTTAKDTQLTPQPQSRKENECFSNEKPLHDSTNVIPQSLKPVCNSQQSSGTSQSAYEVDLTKLSPSMCGDVISQCLSGKQKVRIDKEKRTKSRVTTKRSFKHVITTPKRGARKSKGIYQRTPIVTRAHSKRRRNSSASSDEDQCTTQPIKYKSFGGKRNLRGKNDFSALANQKSVVTEGRQTSVMEENAFLTSPLHNQSIISSQPNFQRKKEAQKRRMLISKSMITGSEELLKEIRTALGTQ